MNDGDDRLNFGDLVLVDLPGAYYAIVLDPLPDGPRVRIGVSNGLSLEVPRGDLRPVLLPGSTSHANFSECTLIDVPRDGDYGAIARRCPHKKSSMTPCVVTDGKSAEADDRHCVGCGRLADVVRWAAVVADSIERAEPDRTGPDEQRHARS